MSDYLSTVAVSKLHGLTAKPLVFDFLVYHCYLSYEGGVYSLTDLGSEYGHVHYNGSDSWIVWDQNKIFHILNDLKLSLDDGSPLCGGTFRKDNLPDIASDYCVEGSADVYNMLISEGYIYYSPYEDQNIDDYQLTAKGKKYCCVTINDDGDYQLVWDVLHISSMLQCLKLKVLLDSNENFKLYHMTHIDNLFEIMAKGLFSHSSVGAYKDVSNISVNEIRNAEEPIFHRPIHNYVPLYFNVRNAMLYAVQSNYADRIIILEFDNMVCLPKDVLFTYNNAACLDAVFYSTAQEFVEDNLWSRIYQRYWGADKNIKQEMMSECLVLDHINSSLIKKIHCISEKVANEVLEILSANERNNNVEDIYYDSWLFFNL